VKTRSAGYRLLSVCAAALLITATVCADTIKLKNGSVIKGKVTTYNDQEFTVLLDLGSATRRSTSRMIIAAEDVLSIEFDGGAESAAAGRMLSTPDPTNDQPVGHAPVRETAAQTSTAAQPLRETSQPARETGQPLSSSLNAAEPPPSSSATIAEKTVKVIAAADWTSTELRVRKGQRVSISANGEVDLGGNRMSNPDGTKISDTRKLIADKPTGALIAVVGDDNDDFVFIGRDHEFTAAHDGILFLSVNEGNLKDNNGSYTARVKVSGRK
jgi:hypothetical protein